MSVGTIVALFVGSLVLALVSFGLHGRLAGTGERVGAVSLLFFIAGWMLIICAALTGAFLLTALFTAR